MNTVAKYLLATICLLIAAYGGWLVITTTLPIGEWLQQKPMWRDIFTLIIIIGIIGFIAGIIQTKK